MRWDPEQGKLDLEAEGWTEWPAAAIARVGPENIRVLDLGNNKLRSIPGAELAKLTKLEALGLTYTRLTTLPPEIGRLTALQALGVGHNRLTALPPEIGCLKALHTLFVDNNGLAALPLEIGRLDALVTLSVHNNPVVDSWPEPVRLAVHANRDDGGAQCAAVMPYLRSLTAPAAAPVAAAPSAPPAPTLDIDGWFPWEGRLDLGAEGRTEWPTAEIARLGPENIRVLDLGNNELTSIPGAELAKLTNLTGLGLTNNRLTALPPEIGCLAALQALGVGYNRLTALPPEIGCLEALHTLWANSNRLTALPPEVGRLPALQTLYVDHNPVVDSWPKSVRRAVNANRDDGGAQCAAVVPYLRSLTAPSAAPAAAAPEPSPPPPHAAPPRPAVPASVFPAASFQYDVFLSHERDTAGPLARALKVHLEQTRPGLRVFLDAGGPRPELHRIHEIIDASASVVLIVSKDVLKSSSVLSEVRHAIGAGKNIVLLHDEASCPFPAAGEVPEDLRPALARAAILYPLQNKRKAASIEALLEQCAAALREHSLAGASRSDEGASSSGGGSANSKREREKEEEEKEADGATGGPTQRKRVFE
eukprot:tig00000042_g15427.t1